MRPSCRQLIFVVLAVLFSLATCAAGPKPIAQTTVGKGNVAFAGGSGPFPPVTLQFVSNDELAIVSVDGRTPPHPTAPEDTRLHLTIEFYKVEGSAARTDGKLVFQTNSDHSGVLFLTSGHFIVNDGRALSLFNENRILLKTRTISDLCGRPFSPLALLSASLQPRSKGLSGVVVMEDYGAWWDSPPRSLAEFMDSTRPVNHTTRCWFNNDNLELLARAGFAPTGEAARYDVNPAATNLCNDRAQVESLYLPADDATAALCVPKLTLIVQQFGGTTASLHLGKAAGINGFVATASEAPLLGVIQTRTQFNPFSVGASSSTFQVVDYEAMRIRFKLEFESASPQANANTAFIDGRTRPEYPFVFAISPDGKRVGVLRGTKLSVYEIN